MRRFGAGNEEEETQIDISPLIDCVFILLIFFIVTTRFIEEKGFEVDKPQPSSSASESESENVVLIVTEKGKVMFEEREIGLKAVTALVERKVQQTEDIPVVVQAEGKSASGLLVRVIDAAKLGGAKSVSLAESR